MYTKHVTDCLDRTHRLALELAQIGADEELIAECLGVEPEAVPALVEIANRKAADIAAQGSPSRPFAHAD
ncbi:MAG TPA: hypothetical protein VGO03_02575 [Acidimicrobiia bacterium]